MSAGSELDLRTVDICGTVELQPFCIYGNDLGHAVMQLAVSCRNGDNLSGGTVNVEGQDGNKATVSVYHA